jgi:uncharacterized membrane protein
MLVFFIPIPVIVFFVLRNETKPKKNLILGVTLPHDKREDPAVTAVIKRFLALEDVVLAILVLLLLPQLLFRYDSVVMTWVMVWLILAIFLPFLPYAAGNKKLRELKRINGWFGASTGVMLVDTKIAVVPRKPLSAWVCIPAFLLTLAPIVHAVAALRGRDEFWPMLCVYLSMSLLVASSFFLNRIINRQRAEVVDGNTPLSAALTQIRRYNWNKAWIWIVWLTSLFDLALWLLRDSAVVVVLLAVAYAAVLLVAILRAEFKTRRLQQKLTKESGGDIYTDDDEQWLLGMFYYNKNDSHAMVNKRIGIGATINLAKAPGKILMIFTALMLLSMPFIGVMIMRAEFTPISLITDGGRIVAAHTGAVYTLDVDSVTSAFLLEKLPGGTRTNGTAMKTVLKGSFRYEGLGDCRLCLDPRMPPFLVIEAGGRTYILGSSDVTETTGIYEILAGRKPAEAS